MKAVINLDVPERQIGKPVCVYFYDATATYGICEAVKVKPRREKFLPCKCGCNRREHWYGVGGDPEKQEILVCKRCGFRVYGKSEADARRNWNKAVNFQISIANSTESGINPGYVPSSNFWSNTRTYIDKKEQTNGT